MLGAWTPTLKRAVPLLISTEIFTISCRIAFSPPLDPGRDRLSKSTLEGGALGIALGSALGNAQMRKNLKKGKIGRAPSELQSRQYLVCRLLLEKKKQNST